MIKKNFLCTILWAITTSALAQTTGPQLAQVTHPSPNVQAMQKYGDIPVSPYTGVPNISIPLYTIQFRDITVPISLSYHASGIKVAEEASQVGLGWVLNAGGTISRTVMGDDDFNGDVYFNDAGNTQKDFADGRGPRQFRVGTDGGGILPMYSKIRNEQTLWDDTIWTALEPTPPMDFQPDQYYYNVPGSNGKFIVKRNKQAIIQNLEKIQVSILSPDGKHWQIKTLDGTTYDFNNVIETYTDNLGNQTPHMSAWYLTSITSPTGNTVTFTYTTFTSQTHTMGSYSELVDNTNIPCVFGFPNSLGVQKGQTPGKIYTQVKLASIDFPTGQVQFNYSYGRADVEGDAKLDSVCIFSKDTAGNLSARPLKTEALTYSYFNYGDADDDMNINTTYASERLKLTQVQETGYYHGVKTAGNPYKFTYFESSSATGHLISKNSFARDHWGYFNGKTANNSLIPSIMPNGSGDFTTSLLGIDGTERNVDTSYLRAFTLQSIQYPTGGSTEFVYESNDFDEQLSEVNDHSFYNQAFTATQKQVEKDFDANRSVDTLHMEDAYKLDSNLKPGAYNAHLQFVLRYQSTGDCGKFFYPGQITLDIYDSTGTNSVLSKDMANINDCSSNACSGSPSDGCKFCCGGIYTYNTEVLLPPAKYIIKVHATYDTALFMTRMIVTYTAEQSSLPPPGNINSVMYSYAGGLRIKEIIDHDGINSSNDKITRYMYHYWADKDSSGAPEEYSFGRRMSKPVYSYFDVCYITSIVHNGSSTAYYTCGGTYFMRCSDSNVPLNGSAQGSVVGYDQVTVFHGVNGENGITTYKYYNQPDLVTSYINEEGVPDKPPYASNITYPLNGSLLEQIEYGVVSGNAGNLKSVTNNNTGYIKLKSVTNNYVINDQLENPVFGVEKRVPNASTYDDGQPTTSVPMTPNFINLYCYRSFVADFSYLSSTDEKVYNQGDSTQYYETTTQYYYDDTAHLLPTRVVVNNSKGEQVTTTTRYPLDYTVTSATDSFTLGIKNLQSKHVINAPVEKYVQKVNAGGSNLRTVGGVLTSYNSSDPTPSLIYEAMLPAPSTSFAAASINTSGLVKDPSYDSLISFDSYDTCGNILQQHKINDVSHSYIWGYKLSLPVAEAVNANANEIYATSFEESGWDSKMSYSSVHVHSGAQAGYINNTTSSEIYSFASQHLVINSTAAIKFHYSGWIYSTGPSIQIYLCMKSTSGSMTYDNISSTATGSWTFLQRDYTVPANTAQIYLRVDNNSTGEVWFDDLRLHPSDARMTTYTYEPLIGMTSVTDINNRTSYYEYDGLCRLKDIKDQDGNILKTFDYHYKQ